jgi:replication initiation protein RepC
MERTNTGWRSPAPAPVPLVLPIESAAKKDLFKAARLAVEALDPRPSAAALLNQLVGFYSGEPIAGRLLVWPSNEVLRERTRLADRTLRYAIRELIELGLIDMKDYANGKRHARRSKSGQIIDAYGFDLSPLLARLEEFAAMVAAAKERRRELLEMFDQITIARRSAQEILLTLEECYPETATDDLQDAFERLRYQTPRRSSAAAPDASLTRWRALLNECQLRYDAACGGKNRRHYENNNDAPDQSCSKRQGENGDAPPPRLNLIDLATACPDAFGYVERIDNERELVRAAARLRGMMGVHESAWEEAREKLGPVMAAAAFFVVLQIYDRDQAGDDKIKNPGGYFRSYIRMIAEGRIDLVDVIRAMRRKRAH